MTKRHTAILLIWVMGTSWLYGEELVVEPVLLVAAQQAEVPAPSEGRLTRWHVHEGEIVRVGEVLGLIDPQEADANVARLRAEYHRQQQIAGDELAIRLAQKTWEVAAAELRRAQDARSRFANSVTEAEIDRLRLVAERAELEVAKAEFEKRLAEIQLTVKEHELQLADLQRRRKAICSPLDGVVAEIVRHAGEWVAPGQTIARVLDTSRVRAEGLVQLPAAFPDLLQCPAQLELPADKKPLVFEGRVTFVAPEQNPVTGEVRIWAEFVNANGLLRPGMKGRMRIELPPEAPLSAKAGAP